MKYKCLFTLLFFCLSTSLAFSQKKGAIDIQYLSLQDTFLVSEIETLITEQENLDYENNLFKKGLGYIKLHVKRFSSGGDTLAVYSIMPGLNSIDKEDPDRLYPPFYTYVGGRLVLIYLKDLPMLSNVRFTKKSKKKFRKKLEPFLEGARSIEIYDEKGNIVIKDKNFRVYYFWLHGSKNIYILKNKPPVVEREKH